MSVKNQAELITTGQKVIEALMRVCPTGPFVLKKPSKAYSTDTDGWSVQIGTVRGRNARLEIWLDRYSGHAKRKFYACFAAAKPEEIDRILLQIPRELTPIRDVSPEDTTMNDRLLKLKKRLTREEFDLPIVERYPADKTFFLGMYSPTRGPTRSARDDFVRHAVAFYESIAEVIAPAASRKTVEREVYPQAENRQSVKLHLRRERSSLLAKRRKIVDDYRCKVCKLKFSERYGAIGDEFAEAHHLDALSKVNGQVMTNLDDLVTVCSNCHRMLHQMPGGRSDVEKLQRTVEQLARKNGHLTR